VQAGKLTKRDELSFLMVAALPKVSSKGLACSSWRSSSPCMVAQVSSHRNRQHSQRTRAILLLPLADGPAITSADWRVPPAATLARYWITFLVFSVLPAPDSPLQTAMVNEASHAMQAMVNDVASRTQAFVGTRLPCLRAEDGLVVAVLQHGAVGGVGHGKHVGGQRLALGALIDGDGCLRVDGDLLVGVDDDAEETRVGLEQGG